MLRAAFHTLNLSALGAIVGTIIAGPVAGLVGAGLGLAAGALSEAEQFTNRS